MNAPDTEGLAQRLHAHVQRLYPPDAAERTARRLHARIHRFREEHPELATPRPSLFDERDVWLIAYGDQVREPGKPPLQTLREVLREHVGDAINGLHLLPHYPWTSDDGFAVVDYRSVDPALGAWSDVEALGRELRLMLDAVINHTSASCTWFRGWLYDDPRYRDHYIALDPQTDTSTVVRPRTSPLLTPFEHAEGTRWVWTTFGPDQVDLNYANPDVLLTVTDVLLSYVARGARVLRLDAIAFLWKQLGTACIHLPETHEVIKLWRTVLDAAAPGTLIITETNVPHRENVSYFGNGADEAHLVYQFPLPPLVLHAFHARDTRVLQQWMAGLQTPSPRTTFLNFLASHDGIGVRPAEGLLEPAQIAELCRIVEAQGGGVAYRALPDGGQSPYELNTVYLDALQQPDAETPQDIQVDRFVVAHSILLALPGVPALYFHALFGSRNWRDGMHHTGRLRVINRQKFDRRQLESELRETGSLRHAVLSRLRERIAVRTGEPAFHPAGPQRVIRTPASMLAFERSSVDGERTVLCIHEVSGRPQRFAAEAADGVTVRGTLRDLCGGGTYATASDGRLELDVPAYGVRWLLVE